MIGAVATRMPTEFVATTGRGAEVPSHLIHCRQLEAQITFDVCAQN